MKLQIEVTEESLTQLDALREEAGLESMKDLVNNALTLLGWAVTEAKKGRLIASVDEQAQSFKELSMPVLEELRRK